MTYIHMFFIQKKQNKSVNLFSKEFPGGPKDNMSGSKIIVGKIAGKWSRKNQKEVNTYATKLIVAS